MSRENLEAFRDLVWEDEAALNRLRLATERSGFEALLIELGQAAGYEFDRSDISLIMRENHLAWLQRWA
ncbi:MAG: Nif11-like leader peptide family natural product precursor [Pyrinomonadaceae bacterium]